MTQILRVSLPSLSTYFNPIYISTLGVSIHSISSRSRKERLGIYSLERGHFEKVRVSDHETCLNVLASCAFLKGTTVSPVGWMDGAGVGNGKRKEWTGRKEGG